MDNFTFYSPTYFVFGKNTENEVGQYVKKFGGKKVLLHYGGGSAIRSGLIDRVRKSLNSFNIDFIEWLVFLVYTEFVSEANKVKL